jgi:hypothetical protein
MEAVKIIMIQVFIKLKGDVFSIVKYVKLCTQYLQDYELYSNT